jgi:hypothetical protein
MFGTNGSCFFGCQLHKKFIRLIQENPASFETLCKKTEYKNVISNVQVLQKVIQYSPSFWQYISPKIKKKCLKDRNFVAAMLQEKSMLKQLRATEWQDLAPVAYRNELFMDSVIDGVVDSLKSLAKIKHGFIDYKNIFLEIPIVLFKHPRFFINFLLRCLSKELDDLMLVHSNCTYKNILETYILLLFRADKKSCDYVYNANIFKFRKMRQITEVHEMLVDKDNFALILCAFYTAYPAELYYAKSFIGCAAIAPEKMEQTKRVYHHYYKDLLTLYRLLLLDKPLPPSHNFDFASLKNFAQKFLYAKNICLKLVKDYPEVYVFMINLGLFGEIRRKLLEAGTETNITELDIDKELRNFICDLCKANRKVWEFVKVSPNNQLVKYVEYNLSFYPIADRMLQDLEANRSIGVDTQITFSSPSIFSP